MARLGKRRWWLKWIGTTLCLLFVLATVATLFWDSVGVTIGKDFVALISGGALVVHWNVQGDSGMTVRVAHLRTLWAARTPGDRTIMKWAWSEFAVWPKFFQQPRFHSVTIPLWLPFLLVLLPTILLWWRDRRFPAGYCPKCGYDLRGAASSGCSECGKPIEGKTA